MIDNKECVKVYCKRKNAYGLVTIDADQGVKQIVNFYGIDKNTADEINTSYSGVLPPVSPHLRECSLCGKRTPMCCNKTHCNKKEGELRHQCLYCSGLDICSEAGALDIYFLMDNSGSMHESERTEGANAVRQLVTSLEGNDNTYSFVAWSSDATYVFKGEKSISEISDALKKYEKGKCGIISTTAADLAFDKILDSVQNAKRPVRIIFVTDGYFDDEKAAVSARNKVLRTGKRVCGDIEIMAIGVKGANEESLKKIGTVSAFSKVISANNLVNTFSEIAEMLRKKKHNI